MTYTYSTITATDLGPPSHASVCRPQSRISISFINKSNYFQWYILPYYPFNVGFFLFVFLYTLLYTGRAGIGYANKPIDILIYFFEITKYLQDCREQTQSFLIPNNDLLTVFHYINCEMISCSLWRFIGRVLVYGMIQPHLSLLATLLERTATHQMKG